MMPDTTRRSSTLGIPCDNGKKRLDPAHLRLAQLERNIHRQRLLDDAIESNNYPSCKLLTGPEPMMAVIRYRANDVTPPKTEEADHRNLIRWSIQEVRRIANKLAQRRIQPAYIIAWSCWRQAHQAASRRAHLRRKMQL